MDLHEKFNKVEAELNEFFVEREEVIHGMPLAILSETNLLFLGPPGTAKSLSVRTWRTHIKEAKYFEWLLTKFSTPEELFGPVSIHAMEEDRYSRITANKLPEAHFALIDEIFKAGTGLLNTLLTALNEKIFHNDGKAFNIPLLTAIGCSNEIPESEDGLEALYDRFLLKYCVKPIHEDSNFKKMLAGGAPQPPKTMITLKEIQEARDKVKEVNINSGMLDAYIKLRKALRAQGLVSTDRTYNNAIKILKAEAFLHGRSEVCEDDFEVLKNVLWSNPDDQRKVWSVILDEISPEKNKIVSLYEKAKEDTEKTLNEKDRQKLVEKGLDTVTNLKTARTEIEKLIETMEKKRKNTVDLRIYISKINDLISSIFSENSIDISF